MTIWRYSISSADSAPLNAPILLRGSIAENIEKAARLGYQAIEVHMRESASIDYEEVTNVCQRYKVNISAIITGRLNTQGRVSLMDDRPYIVESAEKGLRQYIEIANVLKTDIVIGWLKGKIPEGVNPAPYKEQLAGILKIISEYAFGKNVKIFLEVINRYETNLFTTAQETIDFISKWNLENCYVHLDTFHMGLEETNPVEAIRICGNKLGYFHVADNTRSFPGSGLFNFGSYFKVLEEIGYKGYVALECFPGADWEYTARSALFNLRSIA
jgi:sugar phosphate isomerase/epimerase